MSSIQVLRFHFICSSPLCIWSGWSEIWVKCKKVPSRKSLLSVIVRYMIFQKTVWATYYPIRRKNEARGKRDHIYNSIFGMTLSPSFSFSWYFYASMLHLIFLSSFFLESITFWATKIVIMRCSLKLTWKRQDGSIKWNGKEKRSNKETTKYRCETRDHNYSPPWNFCRIGKCSRRKF